MTEAQSHLRCVDTSPLVASQGCPGDLQIICLIVIVGGGKTLLLKTLHTFDQRHGEIKLVLIRKLPPLWLALIELEGVM